MMDKMCLSAIKTEYNRLTKKEKILAEYILKNYESVPAMTSAVLAENAGVVKSVIVRFCKTLGFGGYVEFKLALSRELAKNTQLNFSPYIEREDSTSAIFDKIFAANVKTLHDTAAAIDRKVLNNAVEALAAADNIYIYGIGTSAGIVCDFQYRLMQLGFKAFSFTDIANMKVSTLNIKKNDAAIGISNSGRTKVTVDSLRFAKENGAATICVTSYPNSSIVQNSDYPIVVTTDEIQYPIEAISARIAHISVLDGIAVALSAKHYDDTLERSEKTYKLINSVRYEK